MTIICWLWANKQIFCQTDRSNHPTDTIRAQLKCADIVATLPDKYSDLICGCVDGIQFCLQNHRHCILCHMGFTTVIKVLQILNHLYYRQIILCCMYMLLVPTYTIGWLGNVVVQADTGANMSFSHIYVYTFSINHLCIVCVYNSLFLITDCKLYMILIWTW